MNRTGDSWVAPLTGALVLIGALGVLEILLLTNVLNRYVMPLPSDVAGSLWRVVSEEHIAERFLLTAGEGLVAGLLITAVGVPIGVLMHRVDILRRATETWVAALAAAPVVLAYPLFLVIFKRSPWTIIMIGFVAGLAPVILKTLEGLSAVRPVLIDVARSFKLSAWQIFWKVQFPAAIPEIFTGLRLGLVFAMINIVGVEYLINFGGLGQLINDLSERYDLPGVYAAIFFVILVSVVFFVTLERLERWLRPGS